MGKIFDTQWQPVFNNQQALDAYEMLETLIGYSDPATPSFGFSEMKNSFLQGQAAIYLDSIVISTEVNNPAVSKIVNKVNYALHPKGERYAGQTGGFGLAIPKNAVHKKEAFLLLQWLTNKQQDKKMVALGGVPIRMSTFEDPDYQQDYPYFKTFLEALSIADTDWRPIIPEWGEINAMYIGPALSNALTQKNQFQWRWIRRQTLPYS